jgi:molybdopterin molybdotransferase
MPVAEALARVLEGATPLPAQAAPLADAHGRVLAEDLHALRTQPARDLSAMDGYAVRAADVARVPARLTVVGEVPAGRTFAGRVGAGEAVRIFTGGMVPPGADCVVIQENTQRDGDIVTITHGEAAGRHVRPAGLDFKEGQVLLARGRRLSERDLMLAAAMNYPAVPVHRRPRVAMFATGDELMLPGSKLRPEEIVYSNGYGIMAFARSEGAEVLDLGIVPDRLEETVQAVRRARDLDAYVLVTTGGASVGEYDLVQQALSKEGLDLSFWKVALRPGKPMMKGALGTTRFLGLPGNPVSAYVCALLFLRPLLRRLAGRTDLALDTEPAVLGRDLKANDERSDYLRATLSARADGTLVAIPAPIQDSSMLAPLAAADCLIVRQPFAPAASTGEPCAIVKLAL